MVTYKSPLVGCREYQGEVIAKTYFAVHVQASVAECVTWQAIDIVGRSTVKRELLSSRDVSVRKLYIGRSFG